MPLPADYEARVYAGVLGKIIGVYLGRPFEGWTHERIARELGEIRYYVHQKLGRPLVVTDDDVSGTFTFLRALPDYEFRLDLTPAQIGQTWLNYIVEERTILWWGGLGNSTEHTAYLRLKHGIPAPESGSIARNGRVVAEQIGAQIFVDGWAMVAPGDPELAADLARRAASVSHDGAAIDGARVIAAMEALAFVEPDRFRLLDVGQSLIPRDSLINRLIDDVRDWHARDGDWRTTRARIAERYGYDTYGGNCHIVPNHALIVLGLLYGNDDFQTSLMIANTAGWDTDCNSGNLGCLLGIKNGLPGLESGPDWRGPVADRMYLSTADGGRGVTDALSEAYRVASYGRVLAGEPSVEPKGGARFHFAQPGALQGFRVEDDAASAGVTVENVAGHSESGERSLAIRYRAVATASPARVATPTFIPPEARDLGGYQLYASPTLSPGHTVRARLAADAENPATVTVGLYLRVYGAEDRLVRATGPAVELAPGQTHAFVWRVPDLGGDPIAEIGIETRSERRAGGTVYLDYLTWDGTPNVVLTRPAHNGTLWRRAWVDAVDQWSPRWPEPFRLAQNEGRGLLIHGCREWRDYRVSATIVPHLARAFGLAARVQGLRRYYALLLYDDGQARLVKALDGERTLAAADFPWEYGEAHDFALAVVGSRIEATLDGKSLFAIADEDRPLTEGGIALVCDEGRIATDAVTLRTVQAP